MVPIILDLLSTNYNKWRDHYMSILDRYALIDHVTSDAVHPEVPDWHRMDCVVLSWIYNTVTSDLMHVVNRRGGTTARAAWLGIKR